MYCTPKVFVFFCLSFLSTLGSFAQYDHFEQIEFEPEIQMMGTYKMVIDQKGMLWMSSARGACIFDGLHSRHLSEIHGLPATQVMDYLVDPHRNCIWILTVGGLAKYDGLQVHTYDQFENYKIAKIVLLANGQIMLCGNDGLAIFDGEKVVQRFNMENGLPMDHVRDLVEIEESHWLMVTGKGIIEYKNGEFTLSYKDRYFREIEIDSNDEVYITDVENAYYYKDGVLHLLHTNRLMLSLIKDHLGNVWVNDTKNLVRFNQHEVKVIPFIVNIGKENEKTIGAFVFNKTGTLWVFTLEGTLYRNLRTQNEFVQIDAFKDSSEVSILSGKYNEIFLSNNKAIYKWDGKEFQKLLNTKLIDNFNYSTIYESPRDKLWMYSNFGGLVRADKASMEYSFNKGSLRNKAIFDIVENSNGETFALGYRNLYKYQNPGWDSIFIDSDIQTYLKDLCLGENDELYMASISGVFKYQGNTLIQCKPLQDKVIFKLIWKHNRLWANVNNTRIYALVKNSSGELEVEQEYSPETGYEFSPILDFDFLDSSIVISTRSALQTFNPFKKNVLMKSWTKEDGYQDLIRGGGGKLCIQNDLVHVISSNGFLPIPINKTRSNNIPTSMIEQVEFNHKPISKKHLQNSNSAYSEEGLSIKIPSKENNLRIYYNGIFHESPRNLLFQYRLNGFDDLWSGYTKQRSVTFASLPYGEYEFEVRSISSYGTSSEPAKLFIQVMTPFYRKGWMQVLGFLSLLGLGFIWARNREAKIRREEAQQTEINNQLNKLEIKALQAKMNPHFIFNALNSIQHLIIEKDESSALYYLNKFSTLIRKVLDKASESKIELSEEIEILKNYIELESLRFDAPFEYEINVDPSLIEEHIEIPYLLIQPFVENAIQHGLIHKKEGGKLDINIQEKEDRIFISVEDNGIGRAASALLKGKNGDKISYGISVTKDRLALIGEQMKSETFKILDLYDQQKNAIGTRVELNIPIIQ